MEQVDVIGDVCQLNKGLTGQRVSQPLGQPRLPGGGQHEGQGCHQGQHKAHLENQSYPKKHRVCEWVRRVRCNPHFGLCAAKCSRQEYRCQTCKQLPVVPAQQSNPALKAFSYDIEQGETHSHVVLCAQLSMLQIQERSSNLATLLPSTAGSPETVKGLIRALDLGVLHCEMRLESSPGNKAAGASIGHSKRS